MMEILRDIPEDVGRAAEMVVKYYEKYHVKNINYFFVDFLRGFWLMDG